MTVQGADISLQQTNLIGAAARRPGYLFNPWIDFLCLGGASLIVFPFLVFLVPANAPAASLAVIATATLILSSVINFPHFAHSYQIFYRDYSRKAFGNGEDRILRLRYVAAGIVVPLAIATFLGLAYLSADARLFGHGANVMGFLAGWHYVKQGYGMLIVDSVLKRQFFDEREKKVLLANSYAVWIASWMMINATIVETDLAGLAYYALAMPGWLIIFSLMVVVATSAWALFVIARKLKATGRLPINGLVAYGATLYIWLFIGFTHPTLALVTPAFHSLQYLVVVWRFQLNAEHDRPEATERPANKFVSVFFKSRAIGQFARFIVVGTLLGLVGFWALPIALASVLPPISIGYSSVTVSLFMAWLTINVHHYFLDNVIWRRENPDTRKYLFS